MQYASHKFIKIDSQLLSCCQADRNNACREIDLWCNFLTAIVAIVHYSVPAREQRIAISLSVCLCVCASVCFSVCLSSSVSLKPLDRSSRNWLCGSPVDMACSCSGGVAILYVLPVLCMTSRLAVVGHVAMHG